MTRINYKIQNYCLRCRKKFLKSQHPTYCPDCGRRLRTVGKTRRWKQNLPRI